MYDGNPRKMLQNQLEQRKLRQGAIKNNFSKKPYRGENMNARVLNITISNI